MIATSVSACASSIVATASASVPAFSRETLAKPIITFGTKSAIDLSLATNAEKTAVIACESAWQWLLAVCISASRRAIRSSIIQSSLSQIQPRFITPMGAGDRLWSAAA